MSVKSYLHGVAKAVLSPVVKSLSDGFPNLGPGFHMAFGRAFIYDFKSMSAYKSKIFYSAQNLLVRKYLETPIIINKKVEQKGAARKFRLDQFYSSGISAEKRFAIKQLALEEQSDHELNKLFENPNSYQSERELWEDFWHNYGFGDGFLWFESLGGLSRNNKPVAVHSMSKQRVTIIPSSTASDGVAGYRYNTRNGQTIIIEKDDVMHLKKWNPGPTDLWGLDPSQVVAPVLGLDDASVEAQGSAFMNGGRGTLFSSDVVVDEMGNVKQKMSAAQMEVLRDDIEDSFAGTQNYRKQHFTNGAVTVTNYGDTMAEMDMVKSSVSYWEYTYATLGIPDVLCPTTKASTENNVLIGNKRLVTGVIIPDLRMFDQAITRTVQKWYPGVVICHDVTEFSELAPDMKLMAEVFGKPQITVDERRSIFNYDSIGGEIGKSILVESGLMPIEDILNPVDNAGDPGDPDFDASL
jgi:hypothetical protein